MRVSLLLLAAGCDDYSLGAPMSDDGGDTGGYRYDSGEEPAADDDGAADTGDTQPPEEEDDYLRLTPAATDAYVFVANPTRGTVSRIAVPSLAVLTTAVGDTPTAVVTSPDYAHAVTLDEGSDTVSIIDAETMAVRSVAIRQNFNSLSMSSDGAWVMAWYDPDRESSGSSGGVQSFNEVSFVNLESGVHTPMAVGFNPRGVRWSEDGALALVVCDASLAVIDLTVEVLAPSLVDIAEDPTNAPVAEEVELSPDGQYAFVRQFGADDIAVVDLEGLYMERVPVGANPTDLDLSPDGATIAVVSRGAREIWTMDATNPFGEPSVVRLAEPYGSLIFAGDGSRAILYTNASRIDRFGVWDLATGVVTDRTLVKPVASIGVSPTGGSLLVFHTEDDAEDADTTSPFYGQWAISLIDLGDLHQNPMLLPAEPTAYAMSDDGSYGFFIMEGKRYLETLVFSSLLYEEVALASVPAYLGVLPDTNIAWASQDHELGRISFYDAPTENLDTITGFELNSEIDH